jgi:hypothetical protein
MLLKYSAIAGEYSLGTSSKKMPSMARAVEFEAQPEYVETS